jgi:hypothetical protein
VSHGGSAPLASSLPADAQVLERSRRGNARSAATTEEQEGVLRARVVYSRAVPGDPRAGDGEEAPHAVALVVPIPRTGVMRCLSFCCYRVHFSSFILRVRFSALVEYVSMFSVG